MERINRGGRAGVQAKNDVLWTIDRQGEVHYAPHVGEVGQFYHEALELSEPVTFVPKGPSSTNGRGEVQEANADSVLLCRICSPDGNNVQGLIEVTNTLEEDGRFGPREVDQVRGISMQIER